MNQNRWKSTVLWGAIASLVGMALLDTGLVDDLAVYEKYVEKVLYIGILIGVINNPTSKDSL